MKSKYQWNIKDTISETIVGQYPELDPVILQLLWNRGIHDSESIDNFINADYTDLLDPFLILDMQKSIDRIISAVEKKESILIFGDYDADGVTGSTILYQGIKTAYLALHQRGGGQIMDTHTNEFEKYVQVYIPDRHKEGYGLKDEAVTYILGSKPQLVLTVDCGVRSFAEIDAIQKAGIDVIVIDHHSVPDTMPPAYAIIVPKRKEDSYHFKDLCGAGLAFKVITALLSELRVKVGYNSIPLGYEKWLLDLAAIGTIADMVPLIGENRIIVRYGLYVLAKSKNIGLKALMNITGIVPEVDEIDGVESKNISVYSVGFQIAPRINAAGRIAHANQAFKLFTTTDTHEAEQLALDLQKLNDERKALTENVLKEVEVKLSQYEDMAQLALIMEGDKNWPIGVLGIVASRLVEKYYRPVVLYQEQLHHNVASARSIPEFNIADAVAEMQDLIISGGGHSQAAGLSFNIHKTDAVAESLRSQIREQIDIAKLTPYKSIDIELSAQAVDWDLYDTFYKLAPFGMNNPTPIFLLRKMRIVDIKPLGKDNKHIKLQLVSEDQVGTPLNISAIGFNFSFVLDQIHRNDIIDIVFRLEINEWGGNRELQLHLIDIASNEA